MELARMPVCQPDPRLTGVGVACAALRAGAAHWPLACAAPAGAARIRASPRGRMSRCEGRVATDSVSARSCPSHITPLAQWPVTATQCCNTVLEYSVPVRTGMSTQWNFKYYLKPSHGAAAVARRWFRRRCLLR
jgi:hypothetical protein